jgi:hypothetical protein
MLRRLCEWYLAFKTDHLIVTSQMTGIHSTVYLAINRYFLVSSSRVYQYKKYDVLRYRGRRQSTQDNAFFHSITPLFRLGT